MKNWKSTMAFFIFVGAFVYSLLTGKSEGIIESTGYVALYSSVFMMLRNDFTTETINKIAENLVITRKK